MMRRLSFVALFGVLLLVTAGTFSRLPSKGASGPTDVAAVSQPAAAPVGGSLDVSAAPDVVAQAEAAGAEVARVAAGPAVAVRAASQDDGQAGSFEMAGFPPPGTTVCARPEIVARLHELSPVLPDGFVDLSMIQFLVDGADVTALVQIGGAANTDQGAFIVYLPPSPLATGMHDASFSAWAPDGSVNTISWTFEAQDVQCAGVPPPPPGTPLGVAPETGAELPPPPQISLPGVLHFQANDVQSVQGAEGPQSGQIEVWFDDQTGNGKVVYKDSAGAPQTGFVRNGRSTAQLDFARKQAQITILPEDAPSPPDVFALAVDPLTLKAGVDRGDLPAAGDETVNGRAATKVQVAGPPPAEGRDVYLDKENGLLLRQVVMARSQSGNLEEAGSRQLTYTLVEYLNRGQASDVFSTSVPSDWQSVTSRILTPDSARAFRDFDIYWLGQDYKGMALVNMSHDDGTGPQGPFTGVSVVYVAIQPPADPQQPPSQIVIGQHQLSSQEQQQRQQTGALPSGFERVTAGSRAGVLMTQQGAPGVALDLTIGKTGVVITAADRSQVMQAAQDLQKLN